MIVLGLLIIGITLFGALLLFGVRKNRPRRVEIVTGVFVVIALFSMFGMSSTQDKLEAMVDENFENITEFTECFTPGVDYYSEDLVYTAGETMIDCAIELLNDTTKTYKGYYE